VAGSARRLTQRQRVAAWVLAIVALAFLTRDLGGSSLQGAHSGMRGVLGSLYRGTDAVVGPVKRWIQGVPSAGTNQSAINDLTAENNRLRNVIDQQAADRRTAKQLQQLQLTANRTGRTILPARVIALGPGSGFDWTVTIDAGSNSGVRKGMTVTDGHGLVGRVLHADPNTSVLLLAADPDSGVGVRYVRTGEIGLATGLGADGFTATPLRPDTSVKVGDKLVTGPSSSSTYVAGIPVGVVTSVRAAGGTLIATVRPWVSPTALDVVGVIVTPGDGGVVRMPLEPVGNATHTGSR